MQSSQYGRCKRNMGVLHPYFSSICRTVKLYFAFVYLEKAFDRVPREVTRWAPRKAGVDEWLVKAVMAMYEGAQTAVRTTEGDSKAFNVKVGLHQGFVLSPQLFVIVMEMISRELRARWSVRCCLMHCSETWPMKVEHELKMNRTEMSVIRYMCGVKLNERKKSEELRELLGLEPVRSKAG